MDKVDNRKELLSLREMAVSKCLPRLVKMVDIALEHDLTLDDIEAVIKLRLEEANNHER